MMLKISRTVELEGELYTHTFPCRAVLGMTMLPADVLNTAFITNEQTFISARVSVLKPKVK
jgi:hypothetical protein